MKIRKAIIPAAGLGTRFLPATKAQPKEMLPIVDKPTIQYIVEEAVNSGIEDILIITGRNKRAIEDHFDKSIELELELKKKGKENLLSLVEDITNMVDIHYIRQKEPKGLGHAIYCARAFVGDEPFAVLLGDDIVDAEVPVLKQMIEQYERYNCSIIGVQEVPKSEVDKYGIVDANMIDDRLYRVNNLIEKPRIDEAPSNMAILGRYIISPKIFEILKDIKPGAGGEIQLTDALKVLLEYEAIYAYNFEGKRYDVGDKMGYLKATVEYALKRDDLKDEFMKYLKEIAATAENYYEEVAIHSEK
ncbi:MAG TPA: UTP--glucose-1-phosphate uridylyltransferase GalU [Thermoanaerobacterium sp.]|nr:UTP--glucose-1-phosphate uridylyltransferase GalU [Thermoanaerobacterium sp.]